MSRGWKPRIASFSSICCISRSIRAIFSFVWGTVNGTDNWCGVLIRSRWNPRTVSKTQGSLLITTQFEMQCFRRPAKGRWFTAKGFKCNIIPGGKWGGFSTGWLERFAARLLLEPIPYGRELGPGHRGYVYITSFPRSLCIFVFLRLTS